MSPFSFKRQSSRGSVLIVALLFAAIIAISLTSYLTLANGSLGMASRSFYASSSVNLAETGLEMGLARFNKLAKVTNPDDAWTGWTLDSTPYNTSTSPFTPSAKLAVDTFTPGPGTTSRIEIFAQHYAGLTPTGPAPKLVAHSIITQNNAPPIHKYVEVILRKRTIFGSGVTSILDVESTGGTISIKSWDSDPDNDQSTAAVPYDITKKTANATVASTQGNIVFGGGTHVDGYAMVSPGHTIAAITHATGTTVDDPSRKTYDYDASFTKEDAPTGGVMNTITGNVSTSKTYPNLATDSPYTVGGNTYYYNFGTAYDIDLSGSDNLQIMAGKKVVFILNKTGTGVNNLKTGGSATLEIQAGASLDVYAAGDVTLGGGGLLNDNTTASTFRLYGTNSTPWVKTPAAGQVIKISGSSEFRGVIYAPNGLCEIKGGGSDGRFIGAVVGRKIEFNGNTEFIFDEQINDLTKPDYSIKQWKELQGQGERALYNAVFSSFP